MNDLKEDLKRFGIHIYQEQILIDDKYITPENVLEYIKLVYPDLYKTIYYKVYEASL